MFNKKSPEIKENIQRQISKETNYSNEKKATIF